jgi:hypothetical protein
VEFDEGVGDWAPDSSGNNVSASSPAHRARAAAATERERDEVPLKLERAAQSNLVVMETK